MNGIEEKIWTYIDGNCTEDEQRAMDILIATDEVYKRKYHELSQLNVEFACMLELDEPPMAFTYNVMETIRTENASKPLKAAINTKIVWGVAAFFILSISLLLIFALSSMHWSTGNGSTLSAFDFKMPHIANYFNSTLLNIFVLFDIVLALYLADGYLRRKLLNKQVQ